MSTVKLNIEVPLWIAEYLNEMSENEAEYWHDLKLEDYADQWEEVAGDILAAIESSKEDKCTQEPESE